MYGKRFVVVGAALVAAATMVGSPAFAATTVTGLEANASSAPLGIDDATPTLSWRLSSTDRGAMQTTYRREHFADRLFLSVTGVTPDGVMTDADVLEAEVKHAMLEQAEQSVLLLDGSKLSARGRQAIAPVRAATLVLADDAAAGPLAELGVEVRVTGG